MRYKADYKPQYVLDLCSLEWNPLDAALSKLMDTKQYASPSEERRKQTLAQDNPPSDPEDEKILHPTPADAATSRLSLLQLRVPGVLPLDDLRRDFSLDEMKLFLGNRGPRGGLCEAQVSLLVLPGSHRHC
jgi:arginine-tRNA-protein transferase